MNYIPIHQRLYEMVNFNPKSTNLKNITTLASLGIPLGVRPNSLWQNNNLHHFSDNLS
jgi:hypothetical protein